MRTTIDLPDELFREMKVRAALSGIKLKHLVARYVEQGLRQDEGAPPVESHRRSPLPTISKAASGPPIPALSNAEIKTVLDKEDAEQALRSTRR